MPCGCRRVIHSRTTDLDQVQLRLSASHAQRLATTVGCTTDILAELGAGIREQLRTNVSDRVFLADVAVSAAEWRSLARVAAYELGHGAQTLNDSGSGSGSGSGSELAFTRIHEIQPHRIRS